MPNIAIFASGTGTNAENLIRFFTHSDIRVTRVFCNNPQAEVLQRAHNLSIPICVFSRADFYESQMVISMLHDDATDYIVLAGFLWLIPVSLLRAFPHKILNIHPSLLPKYGGKGMYGNKVHEAVIANKEQVSGITIHLIDEIYDNGEILFQAQCSVNENDTPQSLAKKIHDLEFTYFPDIVQQFIMTHK